LVTVSAAARAIFAGAVTLKFVNFGWPFIIRVGANVVAELAKVTVLKVKPAVLLNNLLPPLPEMAIVDVPALNVRFVVTPKSTTVLAPVSENVPDPILRVRVPVPLQLNTPANVTLGLLTLKSTVPVNAPMLKPPNVKPFMVESTVTVPPPEDASKVGTSLVPGTAAPPAPPLDSDQCVVVVLSHVPVPPTQNFDAI
jgi:hypothetical protein